jgi:hypothetical protein
MSAGLDVLVAPQGGRSEINGQTGIRTRREGIEKHALLVGTPQLPAAERYQERDQDNGQQSREGPRREEAGTDFDRHDILPVFC